MSDADNAGLTVQTAATDAKRFLAYPLQKVCTFLDGTS